MTSEIRRHAPATLRNRDPILAILQRVLPPRGLILEIASGTGEHAAYFSRALPETRWQPSDPVAENRECIAAWTVEMNATQVLPPLDLDVQKSPWPIHAADAILAINLIHIAPWEATPALLRGAATILSPGAPLFLYGPYLRHEIPTAPSNEAFDLSLKERNPKWGLRKLEDVLSEANHAGLSLEEIVEMPANNLSIVLRRSERVSSSK